jgi:hypothetical protein
MSTEIQRRIDEQRAQDRIRAYENRDLPLLADYDDGFDLEWGNTAMTPTAARDERPIPSAEQVADMLLAPATVHGELTARVYEQVGNPSAARRLLAKAYGIASQRLFADAA